MKFIKPKFPKGILLDIGCRDRKQNNFVGIDWKDRPGVDIVHDLEKFPYPIKTESCQTIKCAHVVEHIKPWLIIPFMNELWRMLLPNGQAAISAPHANSPGFRKDPTHCTMITEQTWQYFSQSSPLFFHYRPQPWEVEYLAYKPDANVEVILRKIKSDDGVVDLTTKGLNLGAIQKPMELHNFIEMVKNSKFETVVEIGTANGGMFYVLCQLAADNATLVSMDWHLGQFGTGQPPPDEKKLKSFGKKNQKISVLRGDSHTAEVKKRLNRILGDKKVDLLFIDGDHTYSGVKKDWEMYSPLVKKGGLVVFHDICYHSKALACEVERLWKEIKPNYKAMEIIDPNEQNWGGIGVVEI